MNPTQQSEQPRQGTMGLAVAAIGVVFGDIGTSPLYTLKEVFAGHHPLTVSAPNVMGILSLIFWALIIVVSLKYVVFIMRADNNGEGGIMALLALVQRAVPSGTRKSWLLLALGIFGASLFYGDGMITPAISVLSAVEGLKVATPALSPLVVPLSLIVLLLLFVIQRGGTRRVGSLVRPDHVDVVPSLSRAWHPEYHAHAGSLVGVESVLRLSFFRHARRVWFFGAGRRGAGGHRRRSAVRRHGPFRTRPDPLGVVLVCAAGAAVELFRSRRHADPRPADHLQSVLSASA